MRAVAFLAAALLASTSAHAQFTGSSSLNGGAANPSIPNRSMCLKPPSTFAHVWYVDPNAANGGNGSQASPWNALALANTVAGHGFSTPLLTSAGGGPVAPGDEVLLMSGTPAQYGDVSISGVVNSSFVTIAAAPGQAPVLKSITFPSSALFAVYGLSFQSTAPAPGRLVNANGTLGSPTHDIIFDNLTGASADDATVATWTPAAWQANVTQAVNFGGTNPATAYCLTLSNSHFKYVKNPLQMQANNSIFYNNEVNMFADDGIDYLANNSIISHNLIHNSVNIGDGNHDDGMQGGGITGGPFYYDNFLIDGNTVIFQDDATTPFSTAATSPRSITAPAVVNGGTSGYVVNDTVTLPVDTASGSGAAVLKVTSVSGGVITGVSVASGGLYSNLSTAPSSPAPQVSTSGAGVGTPTFSFTLSIIAQYNNGIGYGDNVFLHFNIQNNIVVWPQHGIGVASCKDCSITGNTSLPAAPPLTGGAYSGGNIQVDPTSSAHIPNGNIVVRNNYMAFITINAGNVQADHNVMSTLDVSGISNNELINRTDGSTFFGATPGTYSNGVWGGNNLVDTGGIASEITAFNSVGPSFAYDFHLLSAAPARGYGVNTTPTAVVDIDGLPRSPTHDVGAHVFH